MRVYDSNGYVNIPEILKHEAVFIFIYGGRGTGKTYGALKEMKEGFVFKYAGGLEARYNDHPDIGEWTNEDGVPIQITRNVSLVDNTKTLGLTAEYRDLLYNIRKMRIDL